MGFALPSSSSPLEKPPGRTSIWFRAIVAARLHARPHLRGAEVADDEDLRLRAPRLQPRARRVVFTLVPGKTGMKRSAPGEFRPAAERNFAAKFSCALPTARSTESA